MDFQVLFGLWSILQILRNHIIFSTQRDERINLEVYLKDINIWETFYIANITLATGGFTYENGILTPAEAKTIYNLNVPSNVLVSANGLLWIKLNNTKTAAQIVISIMLLLMNL